MLPLEKFYKEQLSSFYFFNKYRDWHSESLNDLSFLESRSLI